jgi:hypothetical protein
MFRFDPAGIGIPPEAELMMIVFGETSPALVEPKFLAGDLAANRRVRGLDLACRESNDEPSRSYRTPSATSRVSGCM